jgi:hypothetical protein
MKYVPNKFTLSSRLAHPLAAMLSSQDPALQRDIDRLFQTLHRRDLSARRYQRNLQNAIRRCQHPGQTRAYIINVWTQIASISLESFILFVFSFGYDTMLRRTNNIPHLIAQLREKEIQDLVQQNKALARQAVQLRQQGKLQATCRAELY